MQSNWIVAYITAAVMVTHGHAQELRVSVAPTRSSFSTKEDVEVTLDYTNEGPNDILLYEWCLPNKELLHPLFKVTRDGKAVDYVGPICKRSMPKAEDMITLKSGEKVSTIVQLSTAYDMSEPGTYTVKFEMRVSSTLFVSKSNLETKNTPSVGSAKSILQSDAATFDAAAHPNPIIAKSTQVKTQGKSVTYTYTNCNPNQQSIIGSAIQPAINITAGIVQYLATMNVALTPRYITWFGNYVLSNLIIVRQKFTNISTALSTQPLSFDCGCNRSNLFAFVHVSEPYLITLCPQFWLGPLTGTDSKAGTLIHEISHFTIVAGNADVVYSQSLCQELAQQAPFGSVNNADSFEYFSENNPPLT